MTGDPPRERRLTEEEVRFATEHDLLDLEIDRWSWPEGVFPSRDEEFELVEEHGLNIHCVGLWGKDYLHPDAAETAEAELQRALEYAEAADASVFVTGTEVPADWSEERAWDEGVAFYGELIDRIEARGLDVAFYFGHGDTPLVGFDLDEIRRFTEALPKATLKVDPANLLGSGVDPKRTLHEFGSRVGHFHLKDRLLVETDDGVESVDNAPAGMGDVPWGNLIDLLYLADYDGVLSIEPHGPYWGHPADDHPRRQGTRIAQEQVGQYLKPDDRPDSIR
jgi:sugar phosphate isomerase/epimerase